MKIAKRLVLFLIAYFLMNAAVWPQDISPIVSTEWLSQNLENSGTIVLDIRSTEQYKKGHIPGSISIPLSLWAVKADGLTMELPSDQALADLLGKLGIRDGTSNRVVVVNRIETDFARADSTRVAWTCMIAGLRNVAVLDGGYNKWIREKRPTSTDMTIPAPVLYGGIINRSPAVSKSYVLTRLGKSIVLDARLPEDYFGIAAKEGHIQGALNLPAPWIFSASGAFREKQDLQAMAAGVLGQDTSREVLVYCGVGGYAAAWWFVLSQILGYRDVKVYDGSIEEWTQDPNAPMSTYSWR